MNKLYIKQALLALTITLFVPAFGITERVRAKIHNHITAPAINCFHSLKSTSSYATAQLINVVNPQYMAKKIDSLDLEFKNIENDLRTQEHKAIINLAYKNSVTDDAHLEFCFSLIKTLKKYGRKYMSQSHPYIQHNETVPADLYQIITKNLRKNGINPGSIHIADETKLDEPEDAVAMAPYYKWSFQNDAIVIDQEQPRLAGFIILFKKITTASPETQKAMLIHECEHIKEQHGITCASIKVLLSNVVPDYNEELLLASTEWNALKKIHEQQAEIFPCLRNAKTASRLRKTRAMNHYPDMLYESHYNQLSRIDEMWKQRAWLTQNTKG